MKTNWDETGSTLVEFLIFTPILVLLGLYALSLHQKSSLKKKSLMTARNTILHGVEITKSLEMLNHISNFKNIDELETGENLKQLISQNINNNHETTDYEVQKIQNQTIGLESASPNEGFERFL